MIFRKTKNICYHLISVCLISLFTGNSSLVSFEIGEKRSDVTTTIKEENISPVHLPGKYADTHTSMHTYVCICILTFFIGKHKGKSVKIL